MDAHRIAVLAQQQPERLRALEQRAVADATRPLAAAIADAQAAAVARWIRETISTTIPEQLDKLIDWVRQLLRQAFAGKGAQAQRAAERAAFTAAQQGIQQSSKLAAAMHGQPTPPVTPAIGNQAQAAAEAIPAAVEEEHGHALALLTTAGLTAMGLAGLNSVFKRARRAVGRISRGVASAVGSAAANAARLVATALGGGVRLLWVTEAGACAACRAYAGRHIKPGGQFPGGLSLDPKRTVFPTAIPGPPRHPHCLIGSTRVTGPRPVVPGDVPAGHSLDPALGLGVLRGDDRALAAAAVTEAVGHFGGRSLRASVTRDYIGDVVTIRTASGKELTGTPNHPVATRFGWRALSELQVGDHVITSTRPEWELDPVDPDVDDVPPRIEDVAQALPVPLGPMPCAPEDFHGDGAGSDVYVVRTNSLLGDDVQAAASQVFQEEDLGGRDVPVDLPLASGRSLELELGTLLLAPSGLVGGSGESGSLVRVCAAHARAHGGAPVASLDPSLLEAEADRSAADAEGFCESLLALTGDVTTDELVDVDVHSFSGHVYNLETDQGWYIGNGIVTHNCRCTLAPWSDSWPVTGTPLPTLLQQQARTGRTP